VCLAPIPPQARQARRIDDRSGPGLLHDTGGCFQAEEAARQLSIDGSLPLLGRQAMQLGIQTHAGVVHQDVEPTK
jgi:hypothetical protein